MKNKNTLWLCILLTAILIITGIHFSQVEQAYEKPESGVQKPIETTFQINHLLL